MNFQPNLYRYHDAAGRPFDPRGAVYTAVDIQGMFIDARERCQMPDLDIVEYRWGEPGAPLYAVARHRHTGDFSLWQMNVKTGQPHQVDPPPAGPTLRKKKRPRLSREMKLWRAMKAWEER